MDDRSYIAESLANLWSRQNSMLIQITRALHEMGAQPELLERMLQRLDRDGDTLAGGDYQAQSVEGIAMARSLLAAWRDAEGPQSGER